MTAPHLTNRLSELLGIETEYADAWGRPRQAPEATRAALLAAMGFPGDDDETAEASIARLERMLFGRAVPPVVIVHEGETQLEVAVAVPDAARGRLSWVLEREDGGRLRGAVELDALARASRLEVAGTAYQRLTLAISASLPLGYHRLSVRIAAKPRTITARATVICAPRCCYRPPAFDRDGRRWGIAIQLYNVRSKRNWGIGDFTDLKEVVRRSARLGAAAVGVNPLHALFPMVPQHASPYSPCSRLFLNPLYLDVESVVDFADSEPARRLVRSESFKARLRVLRESEYVDYDGIVAIKLEVMEILYRAFRERSLRAGDHPRVRAFRKFQATGGSALRHFAIYQVLAERAAREGWSFGWQSWPDALRDPRSAEAEAVARDSEVRVEFFEYLQWQADVQMNDAKEIGERLGMSIGIYNDLAVGADSSGSDAWDWQDAIVMGTRAGAPPDPWNMKGQDWGLPPFHPLRMREHGYRHFAELLRANMRRGGALRIDHVIGLMRLFWIPAGAPAADGAYVSYPLDELLAVIALESQRARCLVVGEDLGTVPEGFSDTLIRHGILSYRVFYFEHESDGRIRAPEAYPKNALVTIGTHDLPTLPAFWTSHDIRLKDRLDLWPTPEHRAGEVALRERTLSAVERMLSGQGLEERPRNDGVPVNGVYELLARTPSRLLMLQLEDILGQTEQVNVPGTTVQHPNWRRKLSADIDEVFDRAELRDLAARLSQSRDDRLRLPKALPRAPADTVPIATYRVQLNRTFTFDDVVRIARYLDALGISHLYASPWLKAKPGSTHGYDITDHNAINPELGGPEAYANLTATLGDLKIEQILDFVPNHMGIGTPENVWWRDILEWGRESPYAGYFDIDWNPGEERLRNKVLLPFLADQYGKELEAGKLIPSFDAATGSFSIIYYDHQFPLTPYNYGAMIRRGIAHAEVDEAPEILEALEKIAVAFETLKESGEPRSAAIALKARLAETSIRSPHISKLLSCGAASLSGEVGVPSSFQELHALLERQNYRLAYWGVASDAVNYRRFFNIADLAGIRMESPELFDATHRLVRRLVSDGTLRGLRIDHVDGLFDPADYCARLRTLARGATGRAESLYIVIEKILARHERLRDWPIEGTTGYDYLAQANAVFVDTRNEAAMSRLYERFVGREIDFDEILHQAKILVMETILASELNSLARDLDRLSEEHWSSRDYTLEGLRSALIQVVAYFTVYRTYVTDTGASPEDRRDIAWAVAKARKSWRGPGKEMFDFIERALTTDIAHAPDSGYDPSHALRFARRMQQFTGPVMAKGLEDTTFYRYHRLSSLCEVGSDPRQFGQSPSSFHHQNQERAARWPHGMLASSTHDTKRGEDARARINVLSELPGEWGRKSTRWMNLNRRRKIDVDGQPAPGRNDEYLLYQWLIGGWPLGLDPELAGASEMNGFISRVQTAMLKAVREAKVHTSWDNPNSEYEAALERFVARILDRSTGRPFLRDFLPFQARIAHLGMLNSLSQTALKFTCPGVPDIYQGTELWDFSFVDPDNRRPVQYASRMAILESVSEIPDTGDERVKAIGQLRDNWQDGAIKLFLIRELIALRNRLPQIFTVGDYRPMEVSGPQRERVVAFARGHQGISVVSAVARLFAEVTRGDTTIPPAAVWSGTSLVMPTDDVTRLRDVFSGRTFDVRDGSLECDQLFAVLPVAVLEQIP